MSKLVLHVGTHKTASTTIQKTFAHNIKIAHRAGLVYPELPRQHHGLVADWITLPEFYRYPAGSEAHWRHITKVNKDSDRTVIISTEELSRGTDGNRVNFGELREWTAGFDEVEVVCILRDQLSLIQSIFFEVYRKHGKLDWNKYFADCFRNKRATGVFLDYSDLYDMFLEHFDAKEITFLPYRPQGQRTNPILTLLTHIGFGDLFDQMMLQDANMSSEPLQTWLAVLLNRPNQFDPDLAEAIDPLFAGFKTAMYTRAEAAKVVSEFEPLNVAFLERYQALDAADLEMARYTPETHFFRDQISTGVWVNLARTMRKFPAPQVE